MNIPHFDVIVIGAGPAGAIAAFELAQRGARTLVIESQKLPRHKTCGGGLTQKVAKALPFGISPVVERTISSFVLTYRMGRPRTLHSSDPLVYMVRRSNFDNFLACLAAEAGAEPMDETRVEDVVQTDGSIRIATSRGSYRSDF